MTCLRTCKAITALTVVSLTGASSALTIDLDYTHDTFFSGNATAAAALEAAASDLSDLITTSLTATVDTNASTIGAGSASFDFSYNYSNPATGASTTENTAVVAADTVRVFVGARTLSGSTLGVGGPAGAGVQAGYGYGGLEADIINDTPLAWDAAHTAAQSNMRRGDGPVMGNLSGNAPVDSNGLVGPFSYDVDYGLAMGSVVFDDDSNWHYDHTTAVASGKHDLYSVALHELLHVLGIGTAQSFTDLVDGTDWTGAHVTALINDGVGVIDADGDHIAEGIMGESIIDGSAQEAAMDPSIVVGTRKYLTNIDVAFLQDIGWAVVPEPSVAGMLAGLTLLAGRRRRSV